jgi:hypothetical protein
MALITGKYFAHDDAKEQQRYEELLEAGFSEDEARSNARGCGEPLAVYEQFPDDCLLCGRKLAIPFVFWADRESVGLHVECAAHLSVALKRDVVEHRRGRVRAQQWYAKAKAEEIRLMLSNIEGGSKP